MYNKDKIEINCEKDIPVLYNERVIEKHHSVYRNVGVISNGDYKIMLNDLGMGYSEYEGNLIYQYKLTNDVKQGIFFYIKNIRTKEIFNPYKNAKVIFSPDKISTLEIVNSLQLYQLSPPGNPGTVV